MISSITDSVDNGRSASYGYDPLLRLSTAGTTGSSGYPQWGLSWVYDRYGNRTAQNQTAGTVPAPQTPTNVATNHMTGYTYDANGNLTVEPFSPSNNIYTYDGKNQLATFTSGSTSGAYSYDGNGLRVKKVSGSTTTAYVFSGGKVIAEYANGSLSKEYVYSGAQLLATITGGTTTYHHIDHLSVRMSTNSAGSKVGDQGHFPFGEAWYLTNTTTKWQFTTYERDSESGNPTLANPNPQTSDSQKQESSGSTITLKVENAKTSESSPAENLKSISDLLGAIAWPIVFVVLLLTQRRVLAELLTSIVEVVGKSTRLKLGEVIDVEVDRSAKQVEQGAIEREVPSEEVEAATRVDKLVGDSPLPIIRQRMLEFAREYEATRSNLKPGPQRTRAMNAIAAKMRTLAIAARPFLSEFSQDEHSPGKRLAAITILQLIPNLTYIPWLERRMSEEQPFVFFQASLALACRCACLRGSKFI